MEIHDDKLLSKFIDKYKINSRFSNKNSPELRLFQFQKGDLLLRVGGYSEFIYLLVEGKVKIYNYSIDGKIVFLSQLEPFQIIGEVGSLWWWEPTANVEATSVVYCIGIQLSKYRELLLSDTEFLRFLCQKMALRIISNNEYHSITKFDTLENRLASVILNNSVDNFVKPNLKDWSELLCTSYRHLLRTLKKFCDKGILEKQERKYLILDLKTLKRIASEEFSEKHLSKVMSEKRK